MNASHEPDSPSHSLYDDDISPIEEQRGFITPISPSPDSQSSLDINEYQNASRRPDAERGAPDGQERFTPPQLGSHFSGHQDGVRIASWIANPPAQTYDVRFTDDALERLEDLIGDRAQTFRSNIESLLSDDPRSLYVRNRYPDHEYNCVLEDLSISCIFDVPSAVCTIIAVRSADELQS